MIEPDAYQTWVGRQQESTDIIVKAPLARLAALLDRPDWPWRQLYLPPLGHWLFHLPDALQSALDTDGHAKRGGFLPPIALPRRMWAGSRIRFHHEIPLGTEIVRRSVVTGINVKTNRGCRVFVTIRHEFAAAGEIMITEDQDIVYLEEQRLPSNRQKCREMPSPDAVRRVTADTVVLFRFSALTFNGHRIHYDREYATRVEAYPGLVVHGPLIATMLMDHFLRIRLNVRVLTFTFRACTPLFDGVPFDLCIAERDGEAKLWAQSLEGSVSMMATVGFESAPKL